MESPTRPIKKRKTGMNSSIATLTENDLIANINSIRDLIEVAKNTKKQRNTEERIVSGLTPVGWLKKRKKTNLGTLI